MFSRRTKARLNFGLSVVVLGLAFSYPEFFLQEPDQATESDLSPTISAPSAGFGAVVGIITLWLFDRDIGRTRTSLLRRLLFQATVDTLTRRVVLEAQQMRGSFSIGQLLGAVGYRFWYGVLRPLPSAER